jgi:hypothetical protein
MLGVDLLARPLRNLSILDPNAVTTQFKCHADLHGTTVPGHRAQRRDALKER